MRARFVRVASDLLDERPDLALVLADIGVRMFEARETTRRHPARVINVGIREQLLIGVAAGLAMEGLRPIAHSYAPFLVERPFEQIKLDLSHQGVGAILVSVGASYDAAAEGRTHQAPEDVALLATLPDWEIHVPGHPGEVERLLRHAASSDSCTYIRLSDQANARSLPIRPGRFSVVRHGSEDAPVVIAVGPMLDRSLAATEHLDVTILYAVTVRPFDTETVRQVLPRRADIVLVEPYLAGTSSSEVQAALADRPHRVLSLGVARREHRRYGTAADHDVAHGLHVAGLVTAIGDFLQP